MDIQEKAERDKLNIDSVSVSQSDDEFVDWYMRQQPILTDKETLQEIEKLNKCADFILKS